MSKNKHGQNYLKGLKAIRSKEQATEKAEEIQSEASKPQKLKGEKTPRYTFMCDRTALARAQDMSQHTGKKIKDIFNAAILEYLDKNWTEEKREKYIRLKEELENL